MVGKLRGWSVGTRRRNMASTNTTGYSALAVTSAMLMGQKCSKAEATKKRVFANSQVLSTHHDAPHAENNVTTNEQKISEDRARVSPAKLHRQTKRKPTHLLPVAVVSYPMSFARSRGPRFSSTPPLPLPRPAPRPVPPPGVGVGVQPTPSSASSSSTAWN